MTKGKENSAAPQPRPLRSRKREHPGDEIPQIDGAQDTEEDDAKLVATPPPPPQSSVEGCAMITNQQDQPTGESCPTKKDDSREEKHAEETNTTVKAFEEQEVPCDSDLKSPKVETNNDSNRSGMKEITQEGIRSLSQSCTDQLQVVLPASADSDSSCSTALEKQQDTKGNQDTSQVDPCNMCKTNDKEITKETATEIPVKKKRRMGMCGLTEKERSLILQAQKRETGQIQEERDEKQSNEVVAQEETVPPLFPSSSPSNPEDPITDLSEAEIRAGTKVHTSVTASDGISPLCDSGCSERKSSEAEGGMEPGPEQTNESKSDILAQEEEEEHLVNQELQEAEGHTADVMTKTPEKQREDREDKLTDVDCCPAASSCTNPIQNEETEKEEDGSDAASPRVIEATVELKEEMMADASDGAEAEEASSAATDPGGFNCASVELCEGALTPMGSEKKESCDPDAEPGPFTVNTGHTQTRDTNDALGSGCLDYLSDSQLNTIAVIDEEVMEQREDPGSSDCHEDATDLICGLIRELSSINQRIMATHRELENLQRGSKPSRSPLC